MSKSNTVQNLSQIFRVLSDSTRLRLVITLQEKGEQHVTQLCKRLRAPQPTVSHHLGLLRVHGLVRPRRQGKLVFYSLDPVRYNRACESVAKLLTPLAKPAKKK